MEQATLSMILSADWEK